MDAMIKNNTRIDLQSLSRDAAITLFKEAKKWAGSHWHLDIIDCRWSFIRQTIHVTFLEALEVFKRLNGVPVAFYRIGAGEDYLEIGFYTVEEPTYYLFMNVPLENASAIEALVVDLKNEKA